MPQLGVFIGIDSTFIPTPDGSYRVTYINTLANIRAISDATLGETAYATDTYDLYVYDGENWTTFNND